MASTVAGQSIRRAMLRPAIVMSNISGAPLLPWAHPLPVVRRPSSVARHPPPAPLSRSRSLPTPRNLILACL